MFLDEIHLLYHSRGNWIALTISYFNEDVVANASPSVLDSIRMQIFEHMGSICQQGMGGFKYSIYCEIRDAICADGNLDIDVNVILYFRKRSTTICQKIPRCTTNLGNACE